MGGYQFYPAAANLRTPPQPPSLLDQLIRLQQFRGLQQDQQLRQEQIKGAEMSNQATKLDKQDQETIRQTLAANPGATYGDVLPMLRGNIQPKSEAALVDAHHKMLTYMKEDFENAKSQHDMYGQIYNNVMNMPDDQVTARWPQIAQAISQVPGNKIPVDPNRPMSKQQIAQFGPFLSLNEAYLNAEEEKRGKKAETDLKQAQADKDRWEMQHGPITDQGRFIQDYLQSNSLADNAQNRQRAFGEYNRLTKIQPAQVKVEGLGDIRELPVIDTQNNNSLQYLNANDINKANREQPGRYVPAGEGTKALNKTALLEDIRGSISATRDSLSQIPEFDATTKAKIAVALRDRDPRSAVSQLIGGEAGRQLSPAQQEYLINLAQLHEQAMAMRSVLGAGQGSDDLRAAILRTIPGPSTPNKAYAAKQLDQFEQVLNRLARGVPSVPLRDSSGSGRAQPGGGHPLDKFWRQ